MRPRRLHMLEPRQLRMRNYRITLAGTWYRPRTSSWNFDYFGTKITLLGQEHGLDIEMTRDDYHRGRFTFRMDIWRLSGEPEQNVQRRGYEELLRRFIEVMQGLGLCEDPTFHWYGDVASSGEVGTLVDIYSSEFPTELQHGGYGRVC